MRHGDDGATVHYDGITGHVGIYPPMRDIPTWEPPTDESVWFVPAGWPEWMGTWIEPEEVQGVEEPAGRGSAGIHASVSAESR